MKKPSSTRDVSAEKPSMDLGAGELLELTISSKPAMLCVVRGAVERLAESLGFSPEDCRAITLALDEAIANIMRHSYGGRDDLPIAAQFRKVSRQTNHGVQEGLEIVLRDRGPAVDPGKLYGRDLADLRPGGLGLHFIRQSMDTTNYARDGEFNQWTLTKYLKPTSGAKPV